MDMTLFWQKFTNPRRVGKITRAEWQHAVNILQQQGLDLAARERQGMARIIEEAKAESFRKGVEASRYQILTIARQLGDNSPKHEDFVFMLSNIVSQLKLPGSK